jgi:hypothetical protein
MRPDHAKLVKSATCMLGVRCTMAAQEVDVYSLIVSLSTDILLYLVNADVAYTV